MLSAQIQTKRLAYDIVTGDTLTIAPSTNQLLIHDFAMVNATGSSMDLAMGYYMNTQGTAIYTYTHATTTAVAAASSANIFTTTDNDGYVLQAKVPFGMFVFNISSTSGGGTYEYAYWDGSAFQTFTPAVAPSHASTGYKALIVNPHYKWVTGTGGITGLNSSYYTLRVRATTHPTAAITAGSMKVCKILAYRANVESYQAITLDLEKNPLLLEQGEALIPYFATANGNNVVEVSYKINP